ncbi:MAG TPA: diacylglycerol kinase family protein [Candidatus Dormibacteraeota bacterium]|nr:diacylglycerol kinase family protein [Candidatus Dormibacteraeota bacterium]
MTVQKPQRAFIVVNPRAKNSKAEKEWPELEQVIREEYHGEFHAEFTTTPLHAVSLTRQALREDYELIIALGGDGLINEVVNGFFDGGKPVNPRAILGILPFATGADFVKTLGIPQDFRAAVKHLNSSSASLCDVGLIISDGLDGGPIVRYFINVAECGVGAEVVDRVNRTTKMFGGRASFTWSILRTMPFYRNKTMSYSIDKGQETEACVNNLIVANGRFFGAGLQPAPEAQIDDGLFDVTVIGDIGFFKGARNLGKLRDGTYLKLPYVSFGRGKSISARCAERVLIEADGEVIGRLPATFDLLPAAIKVRA